MSRTDKTKPWRVRVAEHHPTEVHNHDNGICDLPDSPLDGALGVWTSTHCSWKDWMLGYPDQCCHGCACRMCSGYYWRKADRRRVRHQARNATRKAVALQDWETDIHVPKQPW